MPRPKRAKVVHSASIQRVANLAATTEPQAPASNASTESSERALATSDDSEGLITKNPAGVNRRGVARKEVTMSGALATEDVEPARPKPLRARKRMALSRIAREGDHAKAIDALRARMDAEQAAKEQQERGHGEKTTAALEPGVATATANTDVSKPIAEKETRAPPRRESSVLADFKKRPRKPSLLQMVQAQRQQPQASSSDNDYDSLNDFQPDDESTPFVTSKSRGPDAQNTPSASAPSALQTSSSRKRKLGSPEPEIQVPGSQLSASQPSSPPVRPQDAEGDPFDIPADDDIPEPSLPLIRSTQPSSPNSRSDLAPPQRSSPQPARATRTRAPPAKKQPSHPKPKIRTTTHPASSPPPSPLSTISSHPSPMRASPKKAPLKPLTTATLQNLLPRRRVRARDKEAATYDIPSSSDIELSDGQDELSYHKAPRSKAKKSAPTPKKKGGKGTTKALNGRASSTYAKKKIVEVSDDDDGNQEETGSGADDAGSEEASKGGGNVSGRSSTAVKGEMKRLAKKFREVDDWALEIEEVTAHSGSSQMVDAR